MPDPYMPDLYMPDPYMPVDQTAEWLAKLKEDGAAMQAHPTGPSWGYSKVNLQTYFRKPGHVSAKS